MGLGWEVGLQGPAPVNPRLSGSQCPRLKHGSTVPAATFPGGPFHGSLVSTPEPLESIHHKAAGPALYRPCGWAVFPGVHGAPGADLRGREARTPHHTCPVSVAFPD